MPSLIIDAEKRLGTLMNVDRVLILIADYEEECFLRLNPKDSSEREDEFIQLPLMGMAAVAMDK